jgi:hypothetical protein
VSEAQRCHIGILMRCLLLLLTMMEMRLIKRFECFRSTLKSVQQSLLNSSHFGDFLPSLPARHKYDAHTVTKLRWLCYKMHRHTNDGREESARARTAKHVDKVVSEDERRLVAVDNPACCPLDVPQEVPEVNMEQVTVLFDHHVVVVTIRHTEHIRRDAAASAGPQEVVLRKLVLSLALHAGSSLVVAWLLTSWTRLLTPRMR